MKSKQVNIDQNFALKVVQIAFKALKNQYSRAGGCFDDVKEFIIFLDENSEYDQRFFGALLDVKSSGYISNIKSGNKSLYHKSALILADLCKMSDKQKGKFFEAVLRQKLK